MCKKCHDVWIFYLVVVPIVLVGNKKDLRSDVILNPEMRLLKKEDGHKVARKIGAFLYLECSARFNDGVREVFQTVARATLPKYLY